MSENQTIGDRLRLLRSQVGAEQGRRITQAEVADAVGIARSTLTAYEKGHDKPGRDTLLALAQFYNVTVDLLTGTSVSNANKPSQVIDDPDELALIGLWRDMNREQKSAMLGTVRALIKTNAA
ncbi:helix-turn-helix domain-containing protein [Kozakia baliensis]|uniref:helix-turn-helix domain-containing protein n=1 Tax=Kozakia baliensis TaxID=153496 RepID=UPI000690EF4A|nr:helix-turn-helix transcriptional regulator [Kozakia baliensis]